MTESQHKLYASALALLQRASSENGIYASTENKDNYKRVWARDSMIAGIAGLIAEDAIVSEGMRKSIIHLAKKQHKQGQIPSNLAFDVEGNISHVSYGSLVGRVDATTWWIVGTCVYLIRKQDTLLKDVLYCNIEAAINVLETWEFNGRDLIYVPLSGNWADEYVTEGYTLYDQLLRLWGLKLAANIWKRKDWQEKANKIQSQIETNYWIDKGKQPNSLYHSIAYNRTESQPYWLCSFGPAGYDTRFDLMANALALQLGIGNAHQKEQLSEYLSTFALRQNSWLLPVFSPVILPSDPDWRLLSENYAYQFKNHPHHFHNGGIWAVFLGWMAGALQIAGEDEKHREICNELTQKMLVSAEPDAFFEYISSDKYEFGGTKYLCFSAAGIVFPYCLSYPKKWAAWKPILSPLGSNLLE